MSKFAQLPNVKPIQQRSDELTRSFHVYLRQRISDRDRLRATSPDWTGRCQLGRPLQHLASNHTWLAFLGDAFTQYILTLMAIAELVSDKLPKTPSRLIPPQFITRIVMSALCGLAIRLSGNGKIIGLVAGIMGAVAGTFGGAKARSLLART